MCGRRSKHTCRWGRVYRLRRLTVDLSDDPGGLMGRSVDCLTFSDPKGYSRGHYPQYRLTTSPKLNKNGNTCLRKLERGTKTREGTKTDLCLCHKQQSRRAPRTPARRIAPTPAKLFPCMLCPCVKPILHIPLQRPCARCQPSPNPEVNDFVITA